MRVPRRRPRKLRPGAHRRRGRRRRPPTCSTAGRRCSTGWARPAVVRRARWSGWPSSPARGLPRPRPPGVGPPTAAPRGPAVGRRAAREGPVPPAGPGGPDGAAGRAPTTWPTRCCTSRPGHPGVLPRTMPCSGTADEIVGRQLGLGRSSTCPARRALQRVPTRDPLRGTQAHVGRRCSTAAPTPPRCSRRSPPVTRRVAP